MAVDSDTSGILIGFGEVAIALAGFTGVVVAFGSRSQGQWHPGDRLRLSFLLEASLTAAGFALLALLMREVFPPPDPITWIVTSAGWALFMPFSLYSAHVRVARNAREHGDVDAISNRLVFTVFLALIFVQIANVFIWQHPAPVVIAIAVNLAGSAMQFARLIRSAFRD